MQASQRLVHTSCTLQAADVILLPAAQSCTARTACHHLRLRELVRQMPTMHTMQGHAHREATPSGGSGVAAMEKDTPDCKRAVAVLTCSLDMVVTIVMIAVKSWQRLLAFAHSEQALWHLHLALIFRTAMFSGV
jgi:hypothetical protein